MGNCISAPSELPTEPEKSSSSSYPNLPDPTRRSQTFNSSNLAKCPSSNLAKSPSSLSKKSVGSTEPKDSSALRLPSATPGTLKSRNSKKENKIMEEELGVWYHGKITRPEAERLLMVLGKEGAFLVRKNAQMAHVLSVKDSFESVKHYQIQVKEDSGEYYVTALRTFPSINELIEFYRQEKDLICNILTLPCPNDLVPPAAKAKYELDKNNLNLTKELGAGQFGKVYFGTYKKKHKVAVKTLKPDTMPAHLFLIEVLFMLKVDHPNIVKLTGICTETPPLCIVLAFAVNGDLKNYLTTKKAEDIIVDWPTKLNFALQCCSAMEHLQQRGIAHRDLAARNVLLDKHLNCQLSDFGLACFIGEPKEANDVLLQGVRHSNMLPTKWTAPEILTKGANALNPKADVWSFGILQMEIITDGQSPYPSTESRAVLALLKTGFRMECPEGCPDSWYIILMECWALQPEDRPDFTYLLQRLKDIS